MLTTNEKPLIADALNGCHILLEYDPSQQWSQFPYCGRTR
jgi:hypothetical protein